MKYFIEELKQQLAAEVANILSVGADEVRVEYPSEKFDADLAVPVFKFSSSESNPQQVAESVAESVAGKLSHPALEMSEAVSGFVNLWLKPGVLAQALLDSPMESYGDHDFLAGQQVLVEHTDPNPFKELHIGHVYSNTVGESIARLHEAAGAEVVRLSYHGDVGLHIAKAVWAMGEKITWDSNRLSEVTAGDDAIGSYYPLGNQAYETESKTAIEDVNRKVYSGEDDLINQLYEWGKATSFVYFSEVYEQLGVGFDEQIMESESAKIGTEIVKANTGTVFKENDGAIIYEGEQDGLHTRVFISSQGLPTYEAKDLGLMVIKNDKYPEAAKSIVLTANEIDAYFKVVLSAMKKIKPELAEKTIHLSHGMVRLPDGKMSSRTGNVKTALSLIEDVRTEVEKRSDNPLAVGQNTLAAIKYAFLKPAVGGDIIYDVNESVSLEGQTGPYVQYAAVRVQSILAKVEAGKDWGEYDWAAEKQLLMQLAKYPEVTREAAVDLSPHLVAQYLYELARELNRYYETVNVKDAPDGEKAARIALLASAKGVLTHGLGLLNIPTPERM